MDEKNILTKYCAVNWRIHKLFLRKEFDECLQLIEKQMTACRGLCEFAIYVKGLIKRQRGEIQESLQLFQAATCLNPRNVLNLKQVGRSLYLLGKRRAAIGVYNEALREVNEDWEIWHNIGLCYLYEKDFSKAIDAFQRANLISRHDETFLKLGKAYVLQEDYEGAIDIYLDALDFSPDNAEILTAVGLLYLRTGENFKAFEFLGNALTHDASNAKTILAAGSIIQDNNDMAVALIKYRVAAAQTPNSPQLWNNIGMCFFGKQRYVDSIACLKHALYLDPFEWIISYNLGLVHMNTEQYASAFHYFSTCINLKPDFPSSYMYLGIVLSRLDDFDNACSAYEKAIEMESDHLFHLNYAITLYKGENKIGARKQLQDFENIYNSLDAETKETDADIAKQYSTLKDMLGGALPKV
eukprot:g3937.t1